MEFTWWWVKISYILGLNYVTYSKEIIYQLFEGIHCYIFLVESSENFLYFACEDIYYQIYMISGPSQAGRPGGHVPSHFLVDQLSLSQPGGGNIIPTQ